MAEFSFTETGKRIRNAREKRGLSVNELADLISCSASHLDKTERGCRGMSIDLIYAIAVTLNVSMNYLTNCPITNDTEIPELQVKESLSAAVKILNEVIDEIG